MDIMASSAMGPAVLLLLALFLAAGGGRAVQGAREDAFIGYAEKEGAGQVAASSAPGEVVVLTTDYGKIRIKLLPAKAPETCKLVLELARNGSCPGCKFYRHEPVPQGWGEKNFYGPPYALLQGSLADLSALPPFEQKGDTVKKGHACVIPSSKEFFIATADHSEWGMSHTIFGEVEDFETEAKVPFEPFHSYTDGGGITTRWLNDNYAFTISVGTTAAAAA